MKASCTLFTQLPLNQGNQDTSNSSSLHYLALISVVPFPCILTILNPKFFRFFWISPHNLILYWDCTSLSNTKALIFLGYTPHTLPLETWNKTLPNYQPHYLNQQTIVSLCNDRYSTISATKIYYKIIWIFSSLCCHNVNISCIPPFLLCSHFIHEDNKLWFSRAVTFSFIL